MAEQGVCSANFVEFVVPRTFAVVHQGHEATCFALCVANPSSLPRLQFKEDLQDLPLDLPRWICHWARSGLPDASDDDLFLTSSQNLAAGQDRHITFPDPDPPKK